MSSHAAVTDLERLDALAAARPHGRASLAPGRAEATSLVELCALVRNTDQRPAFAKILGDIASATLEHFPENIFWDFDYLAGSILRLGPSERGEVAHLIVSLNRRFGRNTVIAFRYAHDFLYGFDWARWVKKDPDARREIGPFAEVFVRSMDQRGQELEQLIAQDDVKYPKIPSGAARNPFEFSREPDDEFRLFSVLADRKLIPVQAWDANAPLDFARGYTRLRAETASELGLASRSRTAG